MSGSPREEVSTTKLPLTIIGPAEMWDNAPQWKRAFPNFSPYEIASQDAFMLRVDFRAMTGLQRLRKILGAPLIINSAYRTKAHNEAVGGSERSRHLKGDAFDISLKNYKNHLCGSRQQFGDKIEAAIAKIKYDGKRIFNGVGRYNSFIHIDARPADPDRPDRFFYWDQRDT